MLTAQRQEERWRTAVFRHFPPPLPMVRKHHAAGTAVGPRTGNNERVETADREALRFDLNRSATAAELSLFLGVSRCLSTAHGRIWVGIWISAEANVRHCGIVLPNVRAKRATAAGHAGQQAQNGAKPQRLMASVACRWRSA